MKKNTENIQTDTFYHIYNRGINGESIFKSEKNYNYFLKKYAQYISPIADTYAYCLLNNHFHFLIKTKSNDDIFNFLKSCKIEQQTNIEVIKTSSFYISNQFAKLFNSYTQSINKTHNRTGGLFETPFRKIKVESDTYFTQLIWYIHLNPQKHGFVNNFRDYPYSSYQTYQSHLLSKPTKLRREEVINWFGNKLAYQKTHDSQIVANKIGHLILEDD